jgi:hypothetical protein
VALPPPRPPSKPGPPKPPALEAPRERDELEQEARKLEEELEALKAKYDQYFLGIERKEPVRWREELRKRVLRVKEAFTRNTGLKFRIQSLHARYLSYERLWLRNAREKEEGTYRRDLFKARLRARGDEGGEPGVKASEPGPSAQNAPAPAVAARSGSPTEKVAAPRSSAPAAAGGMNDAQLRALYDAYISAKKSCNEDVSRLSYDAVAKSVSKQIPELMARFKAKTVEFKVEVKAGRAVLKAIPKI